MDNVIVMQLQKRCANLWTIIHYNWQTCENCVKLWKSCQAKRCWKLLIYIISCEVLRYQLVLICKKFYNNICDKLYDK